MSLTADASSRSQGLVLLRHDWTRDRCARLFDLPFPDLMFRAQTVHRTHFDPAEVQISTLLSIKTGGCPEDCAYCPQSARYDTGVRAEKLMALDAVLAEARAAKAAGASRFCMGAAWREPKDRDLDAVCAMVEGVKALGHGDLRDARHADRPRRRGASRMRASTTTTTISTPRRSFTARSSPRARIRIASTRWAHVRDAGMHVCCGGIVGMGETREDRVGMIATLASLPEHPESVPINMLVRVAGTPLADEPNSIRSNSCAPSRSRASPCRARGAAVRRARGHERRNAGAVLSRRRQFDLLRAEAAHHAQSRPRPGPRTDGQLGISR